MCMCVCVCVRTPTDKILPPNTTYTEDEKESTDVDEPIL